MINSTSTDMNFAEAWYYSMVAKHLRRHYTPAQKQKKIIKNK